MRGGNFEWILEWMDVNVGAHSRTILFSGIPEQREPERGKEEKGEWLLILFYLVLLHYSTAFSGWACSTLWEESSEAFLLAKCTITTATSKC